MIETPEFQTLKELYDSIPTDDKIGYRAWLKKLHRLTDENPRTVNAVKRRMGISVHEKRKPTESQFIAYDGEGFENKYVLLANSLGERIYNPEGLSTKECLDFLAASYDIPTKRVFFSFGYDINFILRDLSDDLLTDLLSGKTVKWEDYTIKYIPSKIFSVNNYKFYDVFSFFATSFINVVKLMLGEDAVTEGLVKGKEARGHLETWSMEEIIGYNDEELVLLVKIMEKLRLALRGIGVNLNEWYGPGAIAKFWLKENDVKNPKTDDFDLLMALNSAYFGGRFEQISLGTIKSVWEYDIHSAYPAAMQNMPYFTNWTKVSKYENHPYSIWHVSFDLRPEIQDNDEVSLSFFPLPMRGKDGRICFPVVGRGWYWNQEIRLILDYFPNAKITFYEGYLATTKDRPFFWVKSLYDYRRTLKSANNLSQYAIKVGLNSLYGKLAQKVGSNVYFSLASAGYITSHTRATLARAGYDHKNRRAIIGFATDALFSSEKLDLQISDDLGYWEEKHFDKGTFFQSGVYRLENNGENPIDRYRGSPLRNGIDDIIKQLKTDPYNYPKVLIGRFISHLLAIKAPETYGPYRLQFIKVAHRLNIDAPYKRHYMGFFDSFGTNGIRSDYSRLLTSRINSLPKIYVNDDNPFLWSGLVNGDVSFQNVESYSPPNRDKLIQSLLEEATHDFPPDAEGIEDVMSLPVVEDASEL